MRYSPPIFFTQYMPVWVDDLGTRKLNNFFPVRKMPFQVGFDSVKPLEPEFSCLGPLKRKVGSASGAWERIRTMENYADPCRGTCTESVSGRASSPLSSSAVCSQKLPQWRRATTCNKSIRTNCKKSLQYHYIKLKGWGSAPCGLPMLHNNAALESYTVHQSTQDYEIRWGHGQL